MALSLLSSGRHDNLGLPTCLEGPLRMESVWYPSELVFLLAQSAGAVGTTKVDWVETDEAHVFKADLPGLRKEDIRVELQDGCCLQISGVHSQEDERKGVRWHTAERSHGKFIRRFQLPDSAQADSVSAEVENGVLTVTVAKIHTKAPEKRRVEAEALKSLDFYLFF